MQKELNETFDTIKAIIAAIFLAFCLFLIVNMVLAPLGLGLSWVSKATKVAQEEFNPRLMLQRYEWFKNSAAELEKKQADIAIYKERLTAMNETYKNLARQNWPREDREQYNVWSSEVAGAKASYNALAAEYNAQMTKFNWQFTNIGELPSGADKPLPREFKPYTTR